MVLGSDGMRGDGKALNRWEPVRYWTAEGDTGPVQKSRIMVTYGTVEVMIR
jgi:hypothetical protein